MLLLAPKGGIGTAADPDRRALAKAVFLTRKLIAPREDKMCTLVPPLSGRHDPYKVQLEGEKKGTLQQIQALLRIKHALRNTLVSYN